ncbi:MAG: patatin [Bacteroidetes bacterium]|nr:MAG: patatin [Bacteroidota bacterium]
MTMKKILCIDGGGIRGIIPAVILTEIERLTHKNISQLFDLIAGTSTGGILALGLVKPDDVDATKPAFRAEKLLEMYLKEGRKIFPPYAFSKIANLTEEKYSAKGIEQVLMDYFGDASLSDALIDTMITAYEIEKRENIIFKSKSAKADKEKDFYMRDVARGTSAAPTFFEPAQIKSVKGKRLLHVVDGGLFANNPSMCAYIEYAKKNYEMEEDGCLLASIGTGDVFKPYLYKNAVDWGLIHWAKPTIDMMFDGVSNSINYQLQALFETRKNHTYYRFQRELQNQYNDMDDTSTETLNYLVALSERLISEQWKEINELCEKLSK